MASLKKQEELFLLIGDKLKEKTECFVIGGSAMLYYKAKEATKDIDLVFKTEKEREKTKKVLEELGFRVRNSKMLYFGKKNTPILMSRGEDRFDLFYKKIISFELSETIAERATKIYEYNNLIARIVSPEDIILLKCATERAGDRQDAKELIENYNIEWGTIIKEAEHQSRLGEKFVIYLYDFLEELYKDLEAKIPKEVIKKIKEKAEKEILRAAKNKKLL